MAWSIIPKPGEEGGPCKTRCEHRDCTASRAEAEKVCPSCEKLIGYGVAFCVVRDRADLPWVTHNLCAEIDAEREQKAAIKKAKKSKAKKVVSYAAEVQTAGDGDAWTGNALRFASREEAETYAKDLFSRWTAVKAYRVVESSDPVNR